MADSALARLFAELRRRRVMRVAVVYAVAGWLVIQVAATVLPGLHLPEWSVTLVIVLVVLGFPIAFAMAWMFDAGPRGIERTPPAVDPPTAVPFEAPPPAPVPAAAPAAPPDPPAAAEAPPPRMTLRPSDDDGRRTIAVLPFVNMSGDAENEYFSDGIAEEILNLLTQLPQLKVASAPRPSPTRARRPASRPSRATWGDHVAGRQRAQAGDRVRITRS
jgi:adenylate cyclase